MMTTMKSLALFLAFAAPLVQCFSPSSMMARQATTTTTNTLKATMALDLDDDDYRYTLAKAQECAYSDDASIAEAKTYLAKILEFEAECVSGALVGQEICDNVDQVADTVAHLRQKIEMNTVASRPEDWSALPIAMVAMFTVFVAATTMDFGRPDVVPFTMDEWVWAAKGGFLPTMVSHFFRNGGL